MKEFFRRKDKHEAEGQKREKLASEIFGLIRDLEYVNKGSIESLGEADQFGTHPSSAELQQLKNLIEQSDKEQLPEILDNWLIDHEKLISITAHFPDSDLDEDAKDKYFNDMLASYKEKVRRVRELTGRQFQKEKIDLLYSDTEGGEAFDAQISELENSLAGLSLEERSRVVSEFFENLRGYQ